MLLTATPAATSVFTIVQDIDISCPVAKAFSFMNDAPQWLPWAMPQVEAVLPLPFGQWLVKMPHGLAKLRPVYNAAQGSIAYELVSAALLAWRIPVQMLLTPTGCHLAVTFVKPEYLDLVDFQSSLVHTAASLSLLKLVLEQD